MKLTLITKNFYAPKDMESIVNKKFAKLDRYFKIEPQATVIVKYEHNLYKSEVTLSCNGYVFRVEESSEDPYTSVNTSLDKMERRIIRYKSRFRSKIRSNDFAEVAPDDSIEPDEPIDDISATIVRHKLFSKKPMTVEEAIMQMELTDHDFYVFLNGNTFEINVIYKRQDGKYGILEPDVG